MKKITLPAAPQDLAGLRAGDAILASGVLYTARDAGHKCLVESLDSGQPLPLDLKNAAIYYVGPCPAPAGWALGSCGPTTSARMDAYAPRLMEAGVTVMIGKGPRKPEIVEAIRKSGAVYLGATGGAGALLASCVKESELLAYEDLGTEALRRLVVENMPLTVLVDSLGRSIFRLNPPRYADEAELHIHQAQPNEEAEVWAFYRETIHQMNAAGNDMWNEDYPTRSIIDGDLAEGSVYVLEKNGRIIGSAVLNRHGDPSYNQVQFSANDSVLYLHRMAVLPSQQRHGYGKLLLGFLQKKARELGMKAIHLDTVHTNIPGQKLYLSMGFVKLGEIGLAENAPKDWRFWVMEWQA